MSRYITEMVLLFILSIFLRVTHCQNTADATTDIIFTTNPVTEVTTCGGDACYNGVNSGVCYLDMAPNCTCDVANLTLFTGEYCEFILFNDDIVDVSTSARTGNFTWPVPPLIGQEHYNFVYMIQQVAETRQILGLRQLSTIGVILKQEFNMVNETTGRIIELDSGKVNYTVCIMNNSAATIVVEEQDETKVNPSLDNCLTIVTKDSLLWEYTLAAYVIAFLMILTVIALIIIKPVVDRLENKTYKKVTKNDDKLANSTKNDKRITGNKEKYSSDKKKQSTGKLYSPNYLDDGQYDHYSIYSDNVIVHVGENEEIEQKFPMSTPQITNFETQPQHGHANNSFEDGFDEPDADYF